MKPTPPQSKIAARKIAMMGSFPPIRGLSSYCLEISQALAGLVKIEFISFKRMYPQFLYPGGDLSDDPTFPEIDHSHIHVKRRMTWYNPLSWLAEGIATKADLLHAQWWSLPLVIIYGCVCLLFRLRGKPVVFTVHNVLCHDRSKLYRLASRLLFRLGDHFIVHTSQNRAQMASCYHIPPSKISVIDHGSLSFQVRCDVDRDTIRRQMGFEPNHKVILVFGAIRPYKGLETMLKALSKVIQQNPTARLLIAGKLWEKWAPYENLIKTLGISAHVTSHLNYVPSGDVYRYFCTADLVVLPYHHFDSQSGVGATAVAFQKPMLVSKVGGLPDLVGDPHQVFEPADTDGLARAIDWFFTDGQQILLEHKSNQTIIDRLQWPSIARRTCAVYNQVLSDRFCHKEELS